MQHIISIKDLHVSNLRVLVRVDFNVPMDAEGNITDMTRLKAAVPGVRYLLEHNAKVILMSHLGRPGGKRDPKLSLEKVGEAFATLIGKPVMFLDDCIGSQVTLAVSSMAPGSIILLENLRFYPGEEANDPSFAEELAALGEVYINDAFGSAHRAHASVVGVPELIRVRGAGLLMLKELEYLGEKTDNPERPFTVLLGGAKVSDKINIINALLNKVDTMLIGGAMSYTFRLALGQSVGNSLVELDKVDMAKECLKKAEKKKVKIILPVDDIVTDTIDFSARKVGELKVVKGNIPDGWQGVDIGPKTRKLFEKEIATSRTILWNGPMGVFEIKGCADGTNAMADAVGKSNAISIVGGGDSIMAINNSGYASRISFISTGGGASLEFLEGKELPGLKALKCIGADDTRDLSGVEKRQRKPLIVGNWKMNKTTTEAIDFAHELIESVGKQTTVTAVICAPYTALGALAPIIEGSNILLGAQNMHPASSGAYTGEISPAMLRDHFVNYVIIGHSERRILFKEDDAFINQKVKAALDANLRPILCVGETLEEREEGRTIDVVRLQIESGLKGTSSINADRIIIAYEPVWAIGTGMTATPKMAQEVHAAIRAILEKEYGKKGRKVLILYGGSMKPDNAEELLEQFDIDGGLIGGASLAARSFSQIIHAAKKVAEDVSINAQ